MIVASWSGWMPSMRASIAPGSPSRYSRPSWRTSSRVSVQASASRDAVEDDDAQHRRGVGADAAQLLELLGVLGEDDLGAGVGDDERDVVGHRRRVDRRRRAPRHHDGEVGQGPLVARARGDRDAVLGLDAQRHQTSADLADDDVELGPGDGDPLVTRPGDHRVQVGGPVGGGSDAVAEHVPHALRPRSNTDWSTGSSTGVWIWGAGGEHRASSSSLGSGGARILSHVRPRYALLPARGRGVGRVDEPDRHPRDEHRGPPVGDERQRQPGDRQQPQVHARRSAPPAPRARSRHRRRRAARRRPGRAPPRRAPGRRRKPAGAAAPWRRRSRAPPPPPRR